MQVKPGQLYSHQPNEEGILTERDMEILFFYLNRKDLPKLKLDDVSFVIMPYSLYSSLQR